MPVKLDVELNWITNLQTLERNVLSMNKRIARISKAFTPNYNRLLPLDKLLANEKGLKKYNELFNDLFEKFEQINKTGGLANLFLNTFGGKPKDKKKGILDPTELTQFTSIKAMEELERRAQEEEEFEKYRRESEEEKSKEDARLQKEKEKKLREDKKKEEEFRKKELMLMLGRWGKLGVWGIVASQVLKYVSRAVNFAYSTSMQGLDWQRTISGGASGGSWFGQGLASYQRAGIGANQYQGFKRGIQGYLGNVKLGMGNAAPLMYLGLSALGNPDELERELERSLRRLPKDVSLALAGQMGLDYNMWEAIYSGRLDREKSAYSEEAIQKWSMVADKLNDLLTTLKVFGFNKLADGAYNVTHPSEVIGQMGFFDKMLMKLGMANPIMFGSTALLRFGTVEVIVKNEKGEVLGKSEAQPDYNNTMLEYQGN